MSICVTESFLDTSSSLRQDFALRLDHAAVLDNPFDGILVGGLEHFFIFPYIKNNNHPN